MRSPRQINQAPGTERENKMKNILTNLVTSAALLFTLGGAVEAQSIRLHAAVPFAFQMNGRPLNAGDYTISRKGSVVQIQDSNNGKGVFSLTSPDKESDSGYRLVFHRYGDRYFLAEVRTQGTAAGKLPVSRAEKEAMQSEQPREMSTVFVDVRPVVN
jgi:hypothetical protein